jgi:mgtE-like transporter
MKFFNMDFREILSSQMLCVIIDLVAGTILAIYMDKMLLIPGMLILLPGFLEMRGNISGSLACRLSSGLFLGVVKPDKYNTRITRGNFIASFLMVIFLTFVLGVIAFLFSFLIFGIYTLKIIIFPVIAGIIANAIEIPLTFFMTLYLFRKGHDPNNIMGTFVTSTGDITSIVSLFIVLVII